MPFKTDWRKYSEFRSYVFPLGAAERGVSGDGNDGVGRDGNGKRKGNDCFSWRFGRRAPCGMVLLASRRPPQLQVCPLVGVDSLEGFIQKPWIWIPGTSNRGGGGGRGVQRCVGVTRPVSSPVVCGWTDKLRQLFAGGWQGVRWRVLHGSPSSPRETINPNSRNPKTGKPDKFPGIFFRKFV